MFWTVSIAILIALLWTNRSARKWIYIIYKTFPRDLRAAIIFAKVNYKLYQYVKNRETVPKMFTKIAKTYPNKVAFYFEDQTWTFQELEDFSNKVANYFRQQGYQPGESVALLLENRPDYVGLWLGLSKIGVVTALVNTNLVSGPLVHSISVAHSKGIIYGSNFENAINGVRDELKGIKMYIYETTEATSTGEDVVNLKAQLDKASKSSTSGNISSAKTHDTVVYIYTSGTTGLPKAANISHARFFFAGVGLLYSAQLNTDDILYNPLPLYHSSGGMLIVGQTLIYGMSNVLRKKFSASNFWSDCVKYNCTATTYIGEICRYLLATNNTPLVHHKVKKMVGNGLRRDIWEQFQKTFNIPQIYELYGSTEGNANLINIDNTVGAIGFLPRYASFIYPLRLIKCNEETNEPVRNKQGFCITCRPGESGILIGKINQKNAINNFTGYADKKETSKKIIRDAFKPGDLYFNSGDIIVQDEFGYFYFKDRTGSTFRWKSENVASDEVESVIISIIKVREIAVYGVEVPNTDGKAGMVTIVDPEKSVNIEELGRKLKQHLPSYAIPMFLRIAGSLPLTGTFKVKKNELQNEGFDMNKIKDPLYFFDAKKVSYIPLQEVYEDIMNAKMKL